MRISETNFFDCTLSEFTDRACGNNVSRAEVFGENGYTVFPKMFRRYEVEVVMNDLQSLDTERLLIDADGRNNGSMAVKSGETLC